MSENPNKQGPKDNETISADEPVLQAKELFKSALETFKKDDTERSKNLFRAAEDIILKRLLKDAKLIRIYDLLNILINEPKSEVDALTAGAIEDNVLSLLALFDKLYNDAPSFNLGYECYLDQKASLAPPINELLEMPEFGKWTPNPYEIHRFIHRKLIALSRSNPSELESCLMGMTLEIEKFTEVIQNLIQHTVTQDAVMKKHYDILRNAHSAVAAMWRKPG
ncbi:hypothetical protein JW911_03665 [Candidatus Peregrinibacteria bacterium]|nr:hypothetical protein [Candidatus Peregrinibacteria bacterium]